MHSLPSPPPPPLSPIHSYLLFAIYLSLFFLSPPSLSLPLSLSPSLSLPLSLSPSLSFPHLRVKLYWFCFHSDSLWRLSKLYTGQLGMWSSHVSHMITVMYQSTCSSTHCFKKYSARNYIIEIYYALFSIFSMRHFDQAAVFTDCCLEYRVITRNRDTGRCGLP